MPQAATGEPNMKHLAVFLTTFLAVFLACAFVEMNFNPVLWEKQVRFFCVFLGLFGSLVTSTLAMAAGITE